MAPYHLSVVIDSRAFLVLALKRYQCVSKMGGLSSKSSLERRNTVLRRSQRKSVHSNKAKIDKLQKDIKKYKGIEEDQTYLDLKSRIENLERDLKIMGKNLQPQIRPVYSEALKRTQQCHQLLEDKLLENQTKAPAPVEVELKQDKDEDDNVFVEDLVKEELNLEETPNKRRTVELKLIQVEPLEASPQVTKRQSIIKVGVPVMPGAIMEDLNRKTMDLGAENKITAIRQKIEELEMEISQFVGRKNGKYYNKIKEQLESFTEDLRSVPALDDAIAEQIKLSNNYITSCLRFLDEKAEDSDYDTPPEYEGRPPEGALNGTGIAYRPGSFSPRTTYI